MVGWIKRWKWETGKASVVCETFLISLFQSNCCNTRKSWEALGSVQTWLREGVRVIKVNWGFVQLKNLKRDENI